MCITNFSSSVQVVHDIFRKKISSHSKLFRLPEVDKNTSIHKLPYGILLTADPTSPLSPLSPGNPSLPGGPGSPGIPPTPGSPLIHFVI